MTLSTEPLSKRFLEVEGKRMAYHESGEGEPVVFLHGNPTSSYLWRNVVPHVVPHARCVAPDLVGMGDSDKLDDTGPGSYRFVEHRRYVDSFLDQLDLGDRITFVVHDWGSALAFDWARRNPGRVAGIAHMESIVRPLRWEEWPEAAADMFRSFRLPEGEGLVIDQNLFVEVVLPASIIRDLDGAEMQEYRRPYLEAAHRRPTLSWSREIPLGGEPADVVEIVQAYADWLPTSPFPKLFIDAEPGAILIGPQREFCRTWDNQIEVVVDGIHFVQEDSPHEIGEAVAEWLPTR